tara:strand:- start:577 stop:714 length:138 start_codon:yes stop_codon:yes gene_type:complete
MLEDVVQRLGNDVADVAYKLSLLEEEVAKLNAYISDIKNEEKNND